ncbi:MAG TPA: cysteine desulfurase family protein [Coriobacteriia bacterium]|nr:cysteine desulfurase family protein [Coriobacteriia bacterium]
MSDRFASSGDRERTAASSPFGDRVYLDYAATTPTDPRVIEVLARSLGATPGNPSSLYAEGADARLTLETARAEVSRRIGAAHPDEVIFCGSGTESDNAAVIGIARAAAAAGRGRHIVISAFEHHAVFEAARVLETDGFAVDRVAPTPEGVIPPEAVAAVVTDGTALVSVMHANNEIGTVQDIAAIAQVAHRAGALMHTDGAQSLGKIGIDVQALGVDAASFAAHKIYAPKGIGALYLRRGTPFVPLLVGGGQESGRRSGTQDVAGAVAFATALALMDDERADETPRLAALRDRIEGAMRELSGVTVHGAGAPRLPHLSNLGISGVDGHGLVLGLDEEGYAVSSGSACSAGASAPSHVLQAIGAADPHVASLRVTVGRFTTTDDVDGFIAACRAIVERLRGHG